MKMENRAAALMERLPEGMDGVLISSSVGRRYFSGMKSSAGTLLLLKDGARYFIIDFRYIEKAKRTARACKVILQENLYEQLTELMARHHIRRLGIEGDYMTIGEYLAFQTKLPVELVMSQDISKEISKLRMCKSEEELDGIRRAQAVTDAAFRHICGYIRPGLTERDIASELMDYTARHGSEGPSFEYIVVSGKNSSLPHGVPSDKQVQAGDFVTMDFGCLADGYCSDMTRTVAVGHVTEEMRRVYETVLAAQEAAIRAAVPGAVCRDVDAAARNLIDQAGYQGCFGHGTGHSLGLEIHETPAFNTKDETVCEPGMVITVEPGIYLEGKFGVRIEDMVHISENGAENLTASEKKLLIL